MNVELPRSDTDELHRQATQKVMRHLLPMMIGIYFLSFIDRTNVALAKTAFEAQLGISPAVYGFGAGVFYLAYALLELTVTHIFLLWAKDLISLEDLAASDSRARERTCSMKPVIGPRPSSGRPTLGMQDAPTVW